MEILLYGIQLKMFFISQLKASVRSALQSLPTPRNDYEIVVPTQENDDLSESSSRPLAVEDQADADARFAREQEEQRKY